MIGALVTSVAIVAQSPVATFPRGLRIKSTVVDFEMPLQWQRIARAQTKLPSCAKAERAGQKDTSTGKAATSVSSSGRPWRERIGESSRSNWRLGQPNLRQSTMKLASTSPAVARLKRRERLRHDRAAAVALRDVFPALQQLRFELHFESATTSTPASQSHILHPPAQAFFEFRCPYSDCDGQFDLTSAVNAALADPAYQAEGLLECCGARARDCASKQPCQLRLIYTVTAIRRRDT